jgi:2-polyprenyl-3-methyl-5-hydroxy-6-metoxy-1,4-benzoquinol methylase
MLESRQAHWDRIYVTKAENELSWYQEVPAVSLEFIKAAGINQDAAVIDIGGGVSPLAAALLAQGFRDVTVLDLSEKALAAAKLRLGQAAAKVNWITADVPAWEPAQTYDLWHDRAAFHFLTEAAERQAYAARVFRAVRNGGHVVIGTFAPNGPEWCSGLAVMRHDATSIGAVLGRDFALKRFARDDHVTPAGRIQHFQFSLFQRTVA